MNHQQAVRFMLKKQERETHLEREKENKGRVKKGLFKNKALSKLASVFKRLSFS